MSWISNWLYGVDTEAEQKRTDELNAQEKIQAARYQPGGDLYDKIANVRGEDVALAESFKVDENYDASLGLDPNVDAAVADSFAAGIKESLPVRGVIGAGEAAKSINKFAIKTILGLLPWWVWLIGGLLLSVYVWVQIKPFIHRKG